MRPPALQAYLVGSIDYRACLELQHRLVRETLARDDEQATLLLCEHPPCVTVGRGGSQADILPSRNDLLRRGLPLEWVNRGGGCIVHGPGQLAVYPIVPLLPRGWLVGDYLERLQDALLAALSDLRFAVERLSGRFGVWGRSGQLAFFGAAVRDWVTYNGVYLNVAPSMRAFQGIVTDPDTRTPPGSLTLERPTPVRMEGVREAVLRHMAQQFGSGRCHLYGGPPLAPHERIRHARPA